jgi:membrane-bound lytic murein transglycosylase A
MVHQTMSSSKASAPRASNTSRIIGRLRGVLTWALIVGLAAVISPAGGQGLDSIMAPGSLPADTGPLPPDLRQVKTRWVAVRWAELPGFDADALHEAWNAWLKSCERPGPVFSALCSEVRRLSLGDGPAQRAWMMLRLQPYRVESHAGETEGLLTAYYEPQLDASRLPDDSFAVPLYQPPLSQAPRKPWYTRQQIDTLPEVRAQLAGREIAYLANPVDALVLQIQGSGRLRIRQPDGSIRSVRLAYAGSNEHPYKSVGRWLLDQGALRDASWPSIKNWVAQNPARVNDMLWSNPRTVFFREEPMTEQDAVWGPRGAQGVPLTPGRSIAVDPASIPFGTPVWLASSGPTAALRKLVMAQDAGNAITGAVRADYFAGWGSDAQELAGRMKQPMRLWVLWPK